jgi:hypothetical protein
MSTAIGDLVATLGVDAAPFHAGLGKAGTALDEFHGQAKHGAEGMRALGEAGEEAGGELSHSSRAFRFLGKSISEVGESVGGVNSGLGETAGALGGTVSGLGEAAHGYHALHTVMDLAIVKQIALNALSPVGLTLMAGAALAGAAAYMAYGTAIGEWWEKRKKAEEEAKSATSETESAIKELQKEADKLNSTPLEHFQEEMKKTGKSAQAIAEATKKFEELSAAVGVGKARDELQHKQQELTEMGMGDVEKYVHHFSHENPQATQQQLDVARDLAEEIRYKKALADDQKKMAADELRDKEKEAEATKHLHDEVKQLTEGPMDKLRDQAAELKKGFEEGKIDGGEYAAAIGAIKQKARAAIQQEAPKEIPQAIEYGTSQAWEKITQQMYNPEQKANDARIAENTAAAKDLLATIAANTAQGFSLP